MTDTDTLTGRLQAALGDRYTLERELGGGGMSRLFLAREPSLGREVVVKLLPPEMTSDMSAARFQREIELAARFQHPNIVPVLAGGASDGLLFYVMPYVRGESLRRHLAAGQPLPLETALVIVDEVADALAYAHSEGVVHRDIKPENILLSAGHAEVTDFGVARAVDAARSGDRLTGTGIAVGSPGYMSPEQLAGEKTIDARSDQYALGAVAYELLAGAPPFESPTLQGLLTAQLTQRPRPLSERRPEVPAQVSAAITRALAKDPNERFPDIGAFRAALKNDAPAMASGVRRSSRRLIAAAAALVLLAVAFFAYRKRGQSDALDPDVIAVAPFTVLDPSLALWREGMVDVLARKLDGAGQLRAVPPSLTVRRFEGLADARSAEALGRATGAGLALYGSLFSQGRDSARIEATLFDVTNRRKISDVVFVDATSQLARLTDSATVLLLKDLGRGVPRLSSLSTTSLPALKEFLQGEQYYRRSAWDSAAAHYERSVTLDSAFVLSLYRLTSVYGWRATLADPRIEGLAELALRHAHGLSLHDSLLIQAAAIESEAVASRGSSIGIGIFARARHLLQEAVRKYPGSQDAAMAHADHLFHFGPLVSSVGERGLRDMFDRVIELDSTFTPAYSHPVTISLSLGDTAAAHRYLRAYLAHNPTDNDAETARALERVLAADRPAAAMAAFVDTATLKRLQGIHFLTARWPDADESDVRLSRRVFALTRATGPPDARDQETASAARILALALSFRGHLREAAAMLPNVVSDRTPPGIIGGRPLALELALFGALKPTDVDTLFRRIGAEPIRAQTGYTGIPYYAMRRDTASLRAVIARLDSLHRTPPGEPLAAALGAGARGYLALARGDSATALRELGSFPDSSFACSGCYVWHLTRAQLLERAGRWQDAARLLRREPSYWATALGVLWRLERARVAEHLGDLTEARDDYALVVAAWPNPDEQLRGYVDEAQRALRRLAPDAPNKRP